MNEVKTKIRIPICGAIVYFTVTDDLYAERESQFFTDLFGMPINRDYWAMCSYDEKGTFGLFFDKKHFNLSRLAHEIFHLTHRIIDWRYAGWGDASHEFAADLCGWLTMSLYDEMDRVPLSDPEMMKELQTLLSELSEKDRYPDWSPVATKLYDAIYGEPSLARDPRERGVKLVD